MSLMQRAHGWNESQPAALAPERAGCSSHLVDRGADFHGRRLRGSATGTGFPFDGYMSAVQFTGNNAAVASNGNLVLFGTCGLRVHEDRNHPAIRPGG